MNCILLNTDQIKLDMSNSKYDFYCNWGTAFLRHTCSLESKKLTNVGCGEFNFEALFRPTCLRIIFNWLDKNEKLSNPPTKIF